MSWHLVQQSGRVLGARAGAGPTALEATGTWSNAEGG